MRSGDELHVDQQIKTEEDVAAPPRVGLSAQQDPESGTIGEEPPLATGKNTAG